MQDPRQEQPTEQYRAVPPAQVIHPAGPDTSSTPRRRRWPWWVGGGFLALFVLGGIANAVDPPKPAPASVQATPAVEPAPPSSAPTATAAPPADAPNPAAPAPAPGPDPIAPGAAAPTGLTCADVGAAFVAHGTDGRGDCMSVDPRPKCHVAPADQDGNYLAELTMTPPFPGGTIDDPELIAMASNKDCWKQPATQ